MRLLLFFIIPPQIVDLKIESCDSLFENKIFQKTSLIFSRRRLGSAEFMRLGLLMTMELTHLLFYAKISLSR